MQIKSVIIILYNTFWQVATEKNKLIYFLHKKVYTVPQCSLTKWYVYAIIVSNDTFLRQRYEKKG